MEVIAKRGCGRFRWRVRLPGNWNVWGLRVFLWAGLVCIAAPACAEEDLQPGPCVTEAGSLAVLAHDRQELQAIKQRLDAHDAVWNRKIEELKKQLQAKPPAIRQKVVAITTQATSKYMKEAMALTQEQLGAMAAQSKAEKSGDIPGACRWALKTQERFEAADEVHERFYRQLVSKLEGLLAGVGHSA